MRPSHWIPVLLVLGVWRHLIRRFPLRYGPLYWGAVFPLGMYTVVTKQMAAALELPFLAPLPPAIIYDAVEPDRLVQLHGAQGVHGPEPVHHLVVDLGGAELPCRHVVSR